MLNYSWSRECNGIFIFIYLVEILCQTTCVFLSALLSVADNLQQESFLFQSFFSSMKFDCKSMFLAARGEERGSDEHLLETVLLLGNHFHSSIQRNHPSAADGMALPCLCQTPQLGPISPWLCLHGWFVSFNQKGFCMFLMTPLCDYNFLRICKQFSRALHKLSLRFEFLSKYSRYLITNQLLQKSLL